MNNLVLSGNLARDPETKVLSGGSVVTTLTVAVSRYFSRKNGEKDKDVAFIPCEIWDTAAQYISENYSKGDFIIIQGSLKEHRWEDNGQKKSRLIVRINNFERGPRRKPVDTDSSTNTANATTETPF